MNESYAKTLQRLTSRLLSQPGPNSLHTTVFTLTKEFQDFTQQALSAVKNLQRTVLPVLEEFRADYDKKSNKLIKSGNSLISELTDLRKLTINSKDTYMKSAKELNKLQYEFQDTIKTIKETSSIDFNLAAKTNKILDLKLSTDNSYTSISLDSVKSNLFPTRNFITSCPATSRMLLTQR